MSSGEGLRETIENGILATIGPRSHEGGAVVARAICEHLGVDWDMLFHVSTTMEQNGAEVPLVYDTVAKGRNVDVGRALATLLEAAAIPRDGEAT